MKKALFWLSLCAITAGLMINTALSQDSIELPTELLSTKDVNPDIQLFFCPEDNCEQILFDFVQQEHVYCAWYDAKHELLTTLLHETTNFAVLDKHVKNRLRANVWKKSALMHTKFCVNQTHTLFGSTNPTNNGLTKNRNDVLIVNSEQIATYNKQIWYDINASKETTQALFSHNNIDICISPEGNCIQKLVDDMHEAQQKNIHIYAAYFAFTHPRIIQQYRKATHTDATIIVDAQQCGKHCDDHFFTKVYTNKEKLHLKVTVINNTVITGSMNPTKNGNNRNKEITFWIKDEKLAEIYKSYITKMYNSFSFA